MPLTETHLTSPKQESLFFSVFFFFHTLEMSGEEMRGIVEASAFHQQYNTIHPYKMHPYC